METKDAFDEAIPNDGEIMDGRDEDTLLATETELYVGYSLPEVFEEIMGIGEITGIGEELDGTTEETIMGTKTEEDKVTGTVPEDLEEMVGLGDTFNGTKEDPLLVKDTEVDSKDTVPN